jgi:uncharacterized protein with GYD domain
MIRLITRGRFTASGVSGLVSKPEDREPVIRKLVEASGAKLLNLYFTTGDSDFLIIAEGPDAESIMAGTMAAAASGAITDTTTTRAWTGPEFKTVAEKAHKIVGAYRAPGAATASEPRSS